MIVHGIPTHPYFAIAQPISEVKPTTDSLNPDYKKPVLELKNPKTGEVIKAEVQEHWTYTINALLNDNAFCLLVYGINAEKLTKVLCRRYPEIERTQKVRFVLLKQLSE